MNKAIWPLEKCFIVMNYVTKTMCLYEQINKFYIVFTMLMKVMHILWNLKVLCHVHKNPLSTGSMVLVGPWPPYKNPLLVLI
jgi:hypothetical protein